MYKIKGLRAVSNSDVQSDFIEVSITKCMSWGLCITVHENKMDSSHFPPVFKIHTAVIME